MTQQKYPIVEDIHFALWCQLVVLGKPCIPRRGNVCFSRDFTKALVRAKRFLDKYVELWSLCEKSQESEGGPSEFYKTLVRFRNIFYQSPATGSFDDWSEHCVMHSQFLSYPGGRTGATSVELAVSIPFAKSHVEELSPELRRVVEKVAEILSKGLP